MVPEPDEGLVGYWMLLVACYWFQVDIETDQHPKLTFSLFRELF